MADTVETLSIRVAALERKSESNSEDHGKIYGRLESVEKGQGVIQADLRNIQNLCDEIRADVKDLKERPVKRWDGIVNAVVQWFVLGLLASYVVFK